MKLNTFCLNNRNRFILLSVINAVIITISLILGNYSLLILAVFLSCAAMWNISKNNHTVFFSILLFYGLFSRIISYYFPAEYNPIFLFTAFYLILYGDHIISRLMNLRKKTWAGIIVYTCIALFYTICINKSYIFTQMISFNIMILPVFAVLLIRENRELIDIIIYSAPLILIYSIFQYGGAFFQSDAVWIAENALKTYDSMKIAGNLRPFSVFSSVEEFGFFLMILAILPSYRKSRYTFSLSAISVIMLFIYSIRLPLIMIIVFAVYYMLRKKYYRAVLICISAMLLITVILNIIPFKEKLHVSETGPKVFITHSLEPFRNIFSSYSFKKRIEYFSENSINFIKYPWGMGINNNPRILVHNKNIYDSESAFMMLILSCGILMLIFIIAVYVNLIKKVIFGRMNFILYLTFLGLFMLVFSHVLSFHFINLIYYYAIIRSIDDRY